MSVFAQGSPDSISPVSISVSPGECMTGDTVTFSVMSEGRDITEDAVIWLETWPYDGKLDGPSFTDSEGGIYAFHAEWDGVRSPLVYVDVEDPSLCGTATVFAEGVFPEGGWHDVNKKGDGTTGGDCVLCWAATAANMLEWYQERWVEKGLFLPEGAVTGPGERYELKLFELFRKDWTHPAGSQVEYGLWWYLTGLMEGPEITGNAWPIEGRPSGYFLPVMDDLRRHTGESFVSVHGTGTPDMWSYDVTDDPLKAFSGVVRDSIDRGIAGRRIQAPMLHAITLWGYDMDEDGMVTAIYVTDSDDQLSRPSGPREERLIRHEIFEGRAGIAFRAYGTECSIVALTALEGVH